MGDRYISIQQGDIHSTPLEQDYVLQGDFLDGPTEIVAYIGKIRSILEHLNKLIYVLKDGTAEKESFVAQFAIFYQKVDTLSTSICKITKDFDLTINKNRDTIQNLVNMAVTITDSLSKTFPDILLETKETISSTHKIFTQVDSFIIKTDTVLSGIKDAKSILWQDDIKNLQTDLLSLRKVLNDLRVNGLNLPVKLR
jgi:hypothetical protein